MSNENQTQDTEIEMNETEMNDSSESTEGAEAKEPKTPAWEAFAAGLKAHAEALGLEVTEQKGFIKYVNGKTQHKLYVARGGRAVKRVDTTLPLIGKVDSAYALEKPNGKIECHVVPEVQAVLDVLTILASEEFGSLRPSKRAPKAETPASEG